MPSHHQPKPLINYLASLLLLLSGWALAQNLQDVAMVREIERHAPVRGMALSPDEQLLAVTQKETIEIIKLATGEILHTLEEHTRDVNSVAFSPDGSFLASGSDDYTVKIWRTADFSLVDSLEEHTFFVYSVAFSPAGDFLASGSRDNTVKIWRTADFSLVHSLEEHTYGVTSVAFSPTGDFLASGSGDKTVKIWRTADFSLVHSLEEHTNSVTSVAFSPAGDFLASGSSDNTVKIWRTADFSLVHSLEENTHFVLSVAFSPAGDFLASGSWGNITIWQVASGRLLRTLPRATLPISNLIYSAAGDYLLASPSKAGASWSTHAEYPNAVQFWATPERAAVFCPRCASSSALAIAPAIAPAPVATPLPTPLAPQLYVLSPSNNSLLQRNQDEIQLQLSVGEASGVDVVVQANGQNLGLLNTRDFRAQPTGTRLLRVDIPPQLQNRDLNLNIIASNSAGNSSQALYLRYAASPPPPPPTTGRKVLIIGNSNYPGQLYLRNPHNDAYALQEAFASLGFSVTMELDVSNKTDFERAVNNFARSLSEDDVAIIYFSGHGMQLDNINYLIPTQASTVSLASLKQDSVSANYLLDELRFANAKTSIIILDACRNLPDLPQFSSSDKSLMGRGLASMRDAMERVEGTVIAYAAASGQTALDNIPLCSGNACRLSPYATHLHNALINPNYNGNVLHVFEEVQIQVYEATQGRQQPEIISKLYQRVSLR